MKYVPLPGEFWGEDAVLEFILPHLEGCTSLLDVGCDEGKYLHRIRARRPDLYTVALDAHEPSLRQVDAHRKILGKLPEAMSVAPTVDAVICLDVIEHLDSFNGRELLYWFTFPRVARKKVIIFTPLGYMPQPPAPGNPWMEHKSGWIPKDFLGYGYEVCGWEKFDYGAGKRHDALWAVLTRKEGK